MGVPDHSLTGFLPQSEEELLDWEEAFIAVECYLGALQVRNRLLVAEMVRDILRRAVARRREEPDRPARVLAMQEAMVEISRWTQELLAEPLEQNRLAARGRLALLLADMPGKWQSIFLTPPPWPQPFVDAMRTSYLAAGPQFAALTMNPRPLELNAFGSGAAHWWETMDRQPIVRKMIFGLFLLLVAATIWFLFLR